MKRVLVKSVFDAFDYVMDHYYPAGLEDYAARVDEYAVISIQDTHTSGFGLQFCESKCCRGVLTLYFDDIVHAVDGAVLFSEGQAMQVIEFIEAHRDTETLLVHCYGGQSRSRAVGAFAMEMLGMDNGRLLQSGSPNTHVYETLESVWRQRAERV